MVELNHDAVVSNMRYTEVKPGEVFGDINTIYIFGDNLARYGKKGQSVIRHASNSMGIVTKALPSYADNAYLSDADYDDVCAIIENDIYNISHRAYDAGETVHLPAGGFGTDLADLKNKAPRIFDFLSRRLYETFGFVNPGWEKSKV